MHEFARAARVCTLAILVVLSFSALSHGQALTPRVLPDDAQTEPAFKATGTEQGGFFKRLFNAYWEDWEGTNGPEAPRRTKLSLGDRPGSLAGITTFKFGIVRSSLNQCRACCHSSSPGSDFSVGRSAVMQSCELLLRPTKSLGIL
jgi:hypothetical protein